MNDDSIEIISTISKLLINNKFKNYLIIIFSSNTLYNEPTNL